MTRVLKFGGTSVGSAEALANLVEIVRERSAEERVVVVVSALSGVTSALDEAARSADRSIAQRLRERHTTLLRDLTSSGWNGSGHTVDRLLQRLGSSLERPVRAGTAAHDEILGMGERLAAPLVTEVLGNRGIAAQVVDATEVVRTDDRHGGARVDLHATRLRLRERLSSLEPDVVPVITGYVGASSDGAPTTLGRGGSDITAAVVGAAIDADEVEIWSDVDGIFSADPRTSQGARLITRLSHAEAERMAHDGAKVLHPATIPPLAERGIRLSIRNTLRPGRRGTMIGEREPLELLIAGATGNVGSALCRQLQRLRPEGVRLRLFANSRQTTDVAQGMACPTDWRAALESFQPPQRRMLFVDCTASAAVASLYDELLGRGIGVVTANKLAGAGALGKWQALQRAARRSLLPLKYETTVGAGLPLLRTARELASTGDRVLSVDAVVSGTISYVLSRIHEGVEFSEAVGEAQAKGLTEPDPLIDLSGRDVAAKLVILLRELGIPLELSDVDVESLPVDDPLWRARAAHGRLVYVASWRDGVARAGIRTVGAEDPLGRLRPGENIVVFRTARYDAVPLTIAGPGAGPEVTAAGLLAEILEVAS